MARKFMKYIEEMTGASACGTTTNDIAVFAKPVGSTVRKLYPNSVLGLNSTKISSSKKKKSKNK